MVRIELKKDWERGMLKTIPAGTEIAIDEALYEELKKKGLFGEVKEKKAKKQKIEIKDEN